MGEFKVPVQPPISATKDFHFQVPGYHHADVKRMCGLTSTGLCPILRKYFSSTGLGFICLLI